VAIWNIPQVRAKLAELGLDWQDPPSPMPQPAPAKYPSAAEPINPALLFALDVDADTAQATMTAEGTACRVDVTKVDGAKAPATLTQVFDDFREGRTYRVRFRAKADAQWRIKLAGKIDKPDWHSIGLLEDVQLTEEWTTYQYEFQAKNIAAGNMIQFLIGERTGTVWIDDFTVTKKPN
jgi:hypothetical protein